MSPRKDLGLDKRDCILKAARCVFAKQGYADTVVADIAERAGIAKGTVYLYFDSKEKIYLEALLEDKRKLNARTKEMMKAAVTLIAKLRAYIDVRLEYLAQHEDFLRIYLSEVRASMVRGSALPSELFQAFRESESMVAHAFAAAVAVGEIRDVDPDVAAAAFTDVVRGVIERKLLGWSGPTSTQETDFLLDLFACALTESGSFTAIQQKS